jgi:hypothetical protein
MRRIDLIGAFILIAWGGLLVLKPNLFVRGIWKRTDIAQRLLSPKIPDLYTDARTFVHSSGICLACASPDAKL